MAFEAYSVAVKLSLINHVSSGLLMISKSLHSTGQDVDKLNAKLASIGKQAAIGGAMFMGGMAIVSLFKAPLEEAKKFQTETARFNSLGFGDSINTQAVAFAKGMKTIGTSASENMTLVSDAMAVFKDLHHAEFAAPLMAKMKFANEAVFGSEGGRANESKFMDMLKVIEFRGGLSSDKEFSTQADFVQKVISGSRNRVDATQLLTALKTGGVALSRRSNEQFYLGSEPLIQEFGGSRYGTGAMSIYQNLVQSRGTITAQQELYRLGLLDPSMVEFNKAGRLKKSLPGAFKGSSTLENEGELALLEKVLLPAFASKGITTEEGIMRELGMILGNRTGSSLMSRIYQQRGTLHKQIDANKSALGIDPLNDVASQTLAGKQLDLHAKWQNLMLNLGNVVLPLAINALDKLNPALQKLGMWMNDNPEKVKAFTYALLGLSAFLVGGGLINMVIAAGRGFWLLSGVLRFIAVTSLAPLVPLLARLGTYLVIFAVDFVKAIGMFLGSGFLRGIITAFIAPIRLLGTAIMWLGRAFLFTPVGAVIAGIVAVSWLLWNNWKEISASLKLMWSDLKTGFIQLFHGDFAGAFTSFKHFFLLGWQTVFNTLIAGFNSIVPASMAVKKFSFADAPAARAAWSPLVAPVPGKSSGGGDQNINLYVDGKKMTDVVIQRMAREAARPNTGTNAFDPSRSMLMPGTPSAVLPRN
jgi:hypothetical protein